MISTSNVKNLLRKISQMKFSHEYNVWSYLALKSIEILELKFFEKKEYQKTKQNILEELCKEYSRYFTRSTISSINAILDEVAQALVCNRYKAKEVIMKAKNRVAIGTGSSFGNVPFEIGLSFDPIFNVPFIPGSSLKGAFRAALEELTSREKANIVFGSQKHIGLVGITDAYPIKPGENNLILYPDVITPHYVNASTELHVKPIPIVFLTIAPGTVFRFFLFYKEERGTQSLSVNKGQDKDVYNGDLAELEGLKNVPLVDRAVLYALIKGVGAKTALGYSVFELISYKPYQR